MNIFRITFINPGKVYQLHAESVHQSDLYGFVTIDKLIFGETSTLLVDPSEEKLRSEFSGVKQVTIPMHSVIRIDEVEKRGQNKIFDLDSNANVTAFPSGFFTPEKGK